MKPILCVARIIITPELAGMLGECYYKDYCDKHGWAYISLEQIDKIGMKNGIIEFKKGFLRIPIKIPDEIKGEISRLSKPSNSSKLKPSYVFDFLACKIGKGSSVDIFKPKSKDDFRWVEVKTGESELSPNQWRKQREVTIPLVICVIPNVTDRPRFVKTYWYE